MSETYDVGTRAWQPDPTEGWVASEVINKSINGDKVSLVFQLENGEVGLDLNISWYLESSADFRDSRYRPKHSRSRWKALRAVKMRPYRL